METLGNSVYLLMFDPREDSVKVTGFLLEMFGGGLILIRRFGFPFTAELGRSRLCVVPDRLRIDLWRFP